MSVVGTSPRAAALLIVLAAVACGPSAEPVDDDRAVVWRAGPALPARVTNNAVAAIETADGVAVFSFLGLDSTKLWSGVTNAAYRWDVGREAWRVVAPVPGPGRLAATAQTVGGRIYLFGGYTVAADGAERSVPDVNVYDPQTDTWTRAASIPVPTDDAVSGVWRDSLVVLVSGWHDDRNVADVQLYDPARDRWSALTPIPGVPVFGHTGGVAGDVVVYVDGTEARAGDPRYRLAPGSWAGTLAVADGATLEWAQIDPHPGPAVYRAAGGTVGAFVVIAGGTDNPYNYDGIGYDGVPAEPVRQVLAYAPLAGTWRQLAAPPVATMDHRNLAVAGGLAFLVGGMRAGQVVTANTWYADVERLLASVW